MKIQSSIVICTQMDSPGGVLRGMWLGCQYTWNWMNLNDDNSRGNHVTPLYATQMSINTSTTACNWPLILKQRWILQSVNCDFGARTDITATFKALPNYSYNEISCSSYHPSLLPTICLLLQDVEIALPGNNRANTNLFHFRDIEDQLLPAGRWDACWLRDLGSWLTITSRSIWEYILLW